MTNIYLRTYLLFILLTCWGFSGAQEVIISQTLNWEGIISESKGNGYTNKYLYFSGAMVNPENGLPYFSKELTEQSTLEFTFDSLVFTSCTDEETNVLMAAGFDEPQFEIISEKIIIQKKPITVISFYPFRYNAENNTFEKLLYVEISGQSQSGPAPFSSGIKQDYADHSVLKEGTWYKFKVSESGLYHITYNDLINIGLDPSSINPKKIRLFGNGGGMVPEPNDVFRKDDLQEIAVIVEGEDDGTFDVNDQIIFYGQSPNTWEEVLNVFLHQVNLYDEFNYYYLSLSDEDGKRMNTVGSLTENPDHIRTTFNDYQVYEDENYNLIMSGKTWFADEFGESNIRNYSFSFPEIDTTKTVTVKVGFANRTFYNDVMIVRINNELTDTITMTAVNPGETRFANKKKKTMTYSASGPEINVELEYVPFSSASRAWLDYVNINVTSKLNLTQGQVCFRDLTSSDQNDVTEFHVGNANGSTRILDVTSHNDPFIISSQFADGIAKFRVATDTLREFIAFDGSLFRQTEYVGTVENQDIHGFGPVDYVIVTHPLFREQAERLKSLHETLDGFKTLLVEPAKIYNEFSSGKQDPTAIRDMMKMFYDKYPDNPPRYLLLFGDGSFDPKDRLENNTNFVITFQTEESLITSSSYVIDDYFGLLDVNEGEDARGYLDIGIGRIPSQTVEEAEIVVNKIFQYVSRDGSQFGEWRNKICMIADDEDGNLHLEQADSLADGTGFIPDEYNKVKVYLDAYQQEKTPSGERYPDVHEKIKDQVNDGALLVNYIGHGGTGGWAHERILQQADIVTWSNKDKLPVFITATCEFTRFDEPEIYSGGELVLLNPEGGGIALFTTTRLAYAQSNFRLNERIYARAFTPVDGKMPYLGDLIRESKPPNQLTTRNFVLLGDPAVRMVYPEYNITTKTINGKPVEAHITDTLRSLQQITIDGEITGVNGEEMNDFNGYIIPVVYDKETIYKTIGNDPASYPVEFGNQDKIVWSGIATVVNGRFTFSFVLPKDMALNYGTGKISYYAYSNDRDAGGEFSDFIIGGIDANASPDNTGPQIDLFMNNLAFKSGDQTHESPIMLAFLDDESGINLSTNGIGHNITAVLNDDYSNVIQLKEFFTPDTNNYRGGSIEYPFYNLPNGTYTLTVKAWDSYNNSNETTITFLIDQSAPLQLSQVMNYPNPFSDHTTFTFKHTKPGQNLDIQLEIFDLTGKFIGSYEEKIFSGTTETPFLVWDATNESGSRIESGIYIYIVSVTDEQGQVSKQRQKLIVY